MPILLIVSVVLFTTAMVFYTFGVWSEFRAKTLKPKHVWIFVCGVIVDSLATILTYTYVGGVVFTPHAIMGFISLGLMVFHLVWAVMALRKGDEKALKGFHKLTLFVWSVWMFSYLSGFALGMMKVV